MACSDSSERTSRVSVSMPASASDCIFLVLRADASTRQRPERCISSAMAAPKPPSEQPVMRIERFAGAILYSSSNALGSWLIVGETSRRVAILLFYSKYTTTAPITGASSAYILKPPFLAPFPLTRPRHHGTPAIL